jgi:hypothetical protein
MKLVLAAATAFSLMAGAALAQLQGPSGVDVRPTPSPSAIPDNPGTPFTGRNAASKSAKKAPTKDEILRDAAALAKSISLSCEVSDAALLADGMATIDGKPVHVRNFETACSNGTGYFLVDQAPAPVMGFTCFSAEATHAADVAARREPQALCALPANADTKRAAVAVLSRLGQQCQVTGLRIIGRDTAANAELIEAACSGGNGFVIAAPLPGATQAVSALSCPDSYRRGVSCRLSSNGAPVVTMDTFKQALADHHVMCTATNLRLIGKENAKRRHVVEFQCTERPEGLVAFIPLEDSAAPFETMDCMTAGAKARIICTLNQVK